MNQNTILNIAGYKFCDLPEPRSYRDSTRALCHSLGLLGTVILAPEGVNISLAGEPDAVTAFVSKFPNAAPVGDVTYKQSWSAAVPFQKLFVKIKKRLLPIENFPFDGELSERTQISPEEFHRWLSDKKDMVLLDTRNDYEYEVGSFDGAIHFDTKNFRAFADFAEHNAEQLREKTVVTFCTGGIRCEKAAPMLSKMFGYQNVYQLSGGILNYFEKFGSDYYNGNCFVFDERVALDARLQPAPVKNCGDCGKPMTPGIEHAHNCRS